MMELLEHSQDDAVNTPAASPSTSTALQATPRGVTLPRLPQLSAEEVSSRLSASGVRTLSAMLAVCTAPGGSSSVSGVSLSLPADVTPQDLRRRILAVGAHRVPRRRSATSQLVLSTQRYPTQCVALDAVLGGGIASHGVTSFTGDVGCAKSLLCRSLVRSVLQSGKAVLWVDSGGGCGFETHPRCGVFRVHGAVDVLLGVLVRALCDVKKGCLDVVIIDSLSALILAQHQGAWTSLDAGRLAALWQALRSLAAAGCCLVLVTQTAPTLPPIFTSLPATVVQLQTLGGGSNGGRIPLQITIKKSATLAQQTLSAFIPTE